jgi:cytochrome c-type biogenesis protein CcmH/NrfF
LALRFPRLRRFNLKLAAGFLLAFACLLAQDPTSYLTPDVMRVGDRLACRCGGCRNTVGNCPMLHCSSADPLRRRIHEMKSQGKSDDAVVGSIVREEGVVALSSPPAEGFGLFTWAMPPIALLIGFFVWSSFVRGNRRKKEELSEADHAMISRFRSQMDDELGPEDGPHPSHR